jgi:hypothetical protein
VLDLEEMTEMKIEIVKTVSGPDVFRAAIEGEPGLYEEGSTSSEALGKLVRRYPERFGVTNLAVRSHYGPRELVGV